jgi:hypothetical protein
MVVGLAAGLGVAMVMLLLLPPTPPPPPLLLLLLLLLEGGTGSHGDCRWKCGTRCATHCECVRCTASLPHSLLRGATKTRGLLTRQGDPSVTAKPDIEHR